MASRQVHGIIEARGKIAFEPAQRLDPLGRAVTSTEANAERALEADPQRRRQVRQQERSGRRCQSDVPDKRIGE